MANGFAGGLLELTGLWFSKPIIDETGLSITILIITSGVDTLDSDVAGGAAVIVVFGYGA